MLGGTVFLGRHLVAAALARGDEVTIVHRGRHGTDLFPGVERIIADRDAPDGLDALAAAVGAGRSWDAVVDTCGYVPRQVRASAALLAPAVATYCFISSISVYADLSYAGVTETAPVGTLEDPDTEEVTAETYGPLKASCERFADLVIRPGLIVGPHDPSGRFAYWAVRLSEGGPVLAPDPPDQPVQIIDGRDLADLVLACVGTGYTGTLNATGAPVPFHAVMKAGNPDADVVWVEEHFLLSHDVTPWVGLPLWIPVAAGTPGFHQVDVSAAQRAGMRLRPLTETMTDTQEWARRHLDTALPPGAPLLSRAREAELLAAWAQATPSQMRRSRS